MTALPALPQQSFPWNPAAPGTERQPRRIRRELSTHNCLTFPAPSGGRDAGRRPVAASGAKRIEKICDNPPIDLPEDEHGPLGLTAA
jgi:hypothetical protein